MNGLRIGLIVNPIAGMGGSVGLKGTDGASTLAQALACGATPLAAQRARQAFMILASSVPTTEVLVPAGKMGYECVVGLDLRTTTIPYEKSPTSCATRALTQYLIDSRIDVLTFAGGDGTAYDIMSVAGSRLPVLGIPAGVKMHSGVFALTPEAAGRLLSDLASSTVKSFDCRQAEVMDVDKQALSEGRVVPRLYGYMCVPYKRRLLQSAKARLPLNEHDLIAALALEVSTELQPDVTYVVGPGTTTQSVLANLGILGTLLGVDIIRNGKLLAADVGEHQARSLTQNGPMHLIVGVTGGQGFVFGRGNQPISAQLIREAWPGAVTILSSATKLATLPEARLHVDTGIPALDRQLAGFVRVRTAPRQSIQMRVS